MKGGTILAPTTGSVSGVTKSKCLAIVSITYLSDLVLKVNIGQYAELTPDNSSRQSDLIPGTRHDHWKTVSTVTQLIYLLIVIWTGKDMFSIYRNNSVRVLQQYIRQAMYYTLRHSISYVVLSSFPHIPTFALKYGVTSVVRTSWYWETISFCDFAPTIVCEITQTILSVHLRKKEYMQQNVVDQIEQ